MFAAGPLPYSCSYPAKFPKLAICAAFFSSQLFWLL
jgi:hypothetical protein